MYFLITFFFALTHKKVRLYSELLSGLGAYLNLAAGLIVGPIRRFSNVVFQNLRWLLNLTGFNQFRSFGTDFILNSTIKI